MGYVEDLSKTPTGHGNCGQGRPWEYLEALSAGHPKEFNGWGEYKDPWQDGRPVPARNMTDGSKWVQGGDGNYYLISPPGETTG